MTATGPRDLRPAHQRGAGPRLNRTLIVERAIEMIDHDGVSSLTMRSLGSALGVEAISLYRHVNGRADLLEGIVESLMSSIEVEPETRMQPGNEWQSFLRALANNVRRVALAHPVAFPLIATRHPGAPWLRPPLRSLRVVEAFVNGLRRRGFTDRQAVAVYRSFSSFLLGHLLFECAMTDASTPPAHEPADEGDVHLYDEGGRCELGSHPTVDRLQALLMRTQPETDFQEALTHLLVRIDLGM